MAYKIDTIPSFEKQFKKLRKKYPSLPKDLITLSQLLEENPTQGISLGKGCYKIRLAIASKGQGKSGEARVITYVRIVAETVFLLTIYDKAEKGDLESDELVNLLEQLPDES